MAFGRPMARQAMEGFRNNIERTLHHEFPGVNDAHLSTRVGGCAWTLPEFQMDSSWVLARRAHTELSLVSEGEVHWSTLLNTTSQIATRAFGMTSSFSIAWQFR